MKVKQKCFGCDKWYLVDADKLSEDPLYSYCPECRKEIRKALRKRGKK